MTRPDDHTFIGNSNMLRECWDDDAAQPAKVSGEKVIMQKRKKIRLRGWVLRSWRKSLGSWVGFDGTVVYCKWCGSQWKADRIKKFLLERHQKTLKHQSYKLDGSASDKLSALKLAPSVQEFKDALSARMKGESFRAGKAGPEKSLRLAWRLNEALMDQERKRYKEAVTVSVAQDLQGCLLGVRTAACHGKQMTVSQCLTGYTTVKTGAEGIAKGTRQVIRNLWTKRRQPPRGWQGPRNIFHRKHMTEFCEKVDA